MGIDRNDDNQIGIFGSLFNKNNNSNQGGNNNNNQLGSFGFFNKFNNQATFRPQGSGETDKDPLGAMHI